MPWLSLGQATGAAATPESALLSINWDQVLFNLTTHSLRILLILVLTTAGLWLLRRLFRRLGLRDNAFELSKADDQVRRTSTILRLTYTFILVVAWLIASLTILSLLGINITPLLAGAGVVGIALGFGAQSLVQDIIAGLFILLEEKVRVGDVLQVNGVTGVVERLDMRTLTLRDFNGDAHFIQWGKLDRVTNLTLHWSRMMIEVSAPYDAEPDQVIAVLQATALSLHDDPEWTDYFLEEPQVLGITNLADSAIVYRITCRVRASYQWTLARELRRRVWYGFRDAGLSFPFPQQTQSFDASTPLRIQVLEGQAEGLLARPATPHRPASRPASVVDQIPENVD